MANPLRFVIPLKEGIDLTAYLEANDLSMQPPSNAFAFYNAYPFTVQQVLANAPS